MFQVNRSLRSNVTFTFAINSILLGHLPICYKYVYCESISSILMAPTLTKKARDGPRNILEVCATATLFEHSAAALCPVPYLLV
jgi:hypothetical protein